MSEKPTDLQRLAATQQHDFQFVFSDKWRSCTICGKVENREKATSCSGIVSKLVPRLAEAGIVP